jgi:exodeoxyribonuclease VII large subunit
MTQDRTFVFTIRQLTQYVRGLLTQDRTLQDVWVRGEISDCVRHSSGHIYYTLKDDASQLRCVMFRTDAQSLTFVPSNGTEVVARGAITVYEARGQYQLVVREMNQAGLGDLHLRFERLKAKLEAEGLFEEARKRPLPAFPRRLAVLTSGDGAALHDILTTLQMRWPSADVVIIPTPVSGAGAAPGLVRALQNLSLVPALEVAILARGGGSMEELSGFNAEEVARAIVAAPVPVVTGIGHETDFTIADFVADRRAPTPTGAAAAVTPDRRELLRRLADFRRAAGDQLSRRVRACQRELALLRARPVLRLPRLLLAERQQRVDELRLALARGAREWLRVQGEDVRRAKEKLLVLSPGATLARGYAMVRLPGGEVVHSVRQLAVGGAAEVVLHDGTAEVETTGLRPSEAQVEERRDATETG